MKRTKEEVLEAKNTLLEWVKAGDTVYTILRHRSSSGMSRVIDLKVVRVKEGKPEIYNIGYYAAKVLGLKWDEERGGVKVSGCGMDMGFHLVYGLGSVLWGHGAQSDAVKQGYVTGRNGDKGAETDGGYLLRYCWL